MSVLLCIIVASVAGGVLSVVAAAALRPGVDTANRIGLVDELIPEPPPGAHAHAPLVIAAIRGAVIRHLDELGEIPIDELVARRQRRYRAAGG